MEQNEYDTAMLVNVHNGKRPGTENTVYGELRTEAGELLIAATTDYILREWAKRRTQK